ncbi:APH(6) family putative aminoglycoside O-phosphotransferase [Paraburkholderia sp. Ac-20336]|uniref:aminoglycoside phosphotransferase family protein n=1 Tax=Burkholderiaceae TaxID=119060 RepID=UPI0014234153|nr:MULTISPECIES: aminoglycoside phosphotransferase family protein [Burkholderiaceae]MBN3803281.1 APH(6) family putative aminoglycoside O-phosphotransferase [Paraburkholderia sp. Ac-20336]NIF53789.1 APH(6) family putative aminoglycoside O-phosphotransferase [Burkholderia sp. Ax-1724]
MFEQYLKRWNLTIDGDPFTSRSGNLLPVRQYGVAAILKLSSEAEERAGSRLMVWWGGEGAAPVLAHDGEALLMARAQGSASLVQMVEQGRDDDATRILCATVSQLHRPRAAPLHTPLPALVPLTQWFDALLCAGPAHGGIVGLCAQTARELLAAPRDVTVLHGDIHHGNVLDFGPSGWLAIDPKGLYGERAFDYANLFCNPDGESALAPGIFRRRIELVADVAGIEPRRLLQWVLAWTGLSTVWMLEDGEDGDDAGSRLEIGKLAAAALGIVE